MLAKKPLWDTFGAEIEGVDLSGELPPDTVRFILATLHEHQVLRFRNQSLSPEQFDRYGRIYGEPTPHVLDHFRLPGLPAVMKLTNASDRPDAIINGAAYWHTDQSYDADPSSATTLHAIKVPKAGGGTRLANMFAAYDDLPESMKRKVDGLTVLHSYGNRDQGLDGEPEASPPRKEQWSKLVPVKHPLARPHPITGRIALYAVAGTSRGIEGWPEDEAVDFLRELKAHALQPQYVRTLYYEVGDVAVWDTSSTMHAAEPLEEAAGEEDTRLMIRVSVRGKPPLLQ